MLFPYPFSMDPEILAKARIQLKEIKWLQIIEKDSEFKPVGSGGNRI